MLSGSKFAARTAAALAIVAMTGAPLPADAFAVFKVDPYCPDPTVFGTIQEAVDAAAAYSDADRADYVWISDNTTINGYDKQHIVVDDPESVIIEGGFFDCTDFDPGTDQSVVSGAGNDGGPVFDIRGGNVYLGNLVITGANRDADQNGGGVGFYGHGMLTIANSVIELNTSGTGGGMGLAASGGPLEVTIGENVQIMFNTANDSGGGLHIDGDTRLTMDGAQSFIGYNHALNGYGGGLSIAGPASAHIGTSGYSAFGAFYSNDAGYGGAIAAFGTADGAAKVDLYTTDPQHPLRISGNFARSAGGAFYAKAHADHFGNPNTAYVCASQFVINHNGAPDGAAGYLDFDTAFPTPDIGAVLDLNTGCAGAHASCAAGVACNLISDNVAEDASSNPTAGATLTIGHAGDFDAQNLEMRRNRSAILIERRYDDSENGSTRAIRTCLFADNQTTGDLLSFSAHLPISLDGCTIAGNTIGGRVFDYVGSLTNALIEQPGVTVGQANALYVLSTDISHLTSSPTVRSLADAGFVDAAHSDYHLGPYSPALDFAGGVGGFDLENLPRDRDLTGVPNMFGPRDVGAYERQFLCAADTIFCSGFEH